MSSQASGPRPYIVLPPRPVSQAASQAPADWGSARIINLANNESRYGSSPNALEYARKRCDLLNLYADPACTEMRAAIARVYGLSEAQICCGNGSEELLDIVGRIYARPGDEILFLEQGFLLYPIICMRTGATAVTAPLGDRFAISVDALLARVSERTKIVFLANPENPTGRYLPLAELRRLRAGLPSHVMLVVDSAYCEFVGDPAYTAGFELVDDLSNVLVTRTFSKAFGLAGARAGWAYAGPATVPLINRVRGIGNVNAIAQAVAIGALGDLDFVESVVSRTIAERARLAAAFMRFGLEPVPSGANFMLVRFPESGPMTATEAHAQLGARGLRVRPGSDFKMNDYLRITIGTREDNDALLHALGAA
jgi:histidinol-phosphate aminotransferase